MYVKLRNKERKLGEEAKTYEDLDLIDEEPVTESNEKKDEVKEEKPVEKVKNRDDEDDEEIKEDEVEEEFDVKDGGFD